MPSLCFIVLGAAAGIACYAYLGYPLALWILSRSRPPRRPSVPPSEWPLISITVPVYNEEQNIRAKLERLLALDYPAERRQILVVSDASTDRTDEIVRSFADRGIALLRLPQRGGKTAAESAARYRMRGEIVITTDASVRIDPYALKPLVASFGDPTVGVASCRDVSVARIENDPTVGESAYVCYEMWIRRLETRVYGLVGASGCLFAMRADLHRHLVPEALSWDFAAPLSAREHGYRSVSVQEAICYVARAGSLRKEYRRKVRTITRGLETLWYHRRLLNPFRHGFFAWMLWSHKLCRWLVPWALVLAVVTLGVLSVGAAWARVVLGAISVGIVLGALGWVWAEGRQIPRVFGFPAYVLVGNLAVLVAWISALRGEPDPIWEPTRREAVDGPMVRQA